MAFYSLQADFSKGQISPLLGARADVDFWRQSLYEVVNFQVMTHGGLRRRSGTRFIAEVADSSNLARIFPFKFSEEQSYVLSLNDGKIRFFAQRGVVGAPYEIAHPYSDANLDRLSYSQFNDVGYFAHKGYRPREIARNGETSWALTQQTFKDGPYLERDTSGTTLTPAAYGSSVPKMTGLTSPSGTVSSSTSSSTAWQVFDKDKSTYWLSSGQAGSVDYAFASGTRVVNAYFITSHSAFATSAPTSWSLQGYDGSSWVTLDTRQSETGWGGGETRFYEFDNESAYEAYRFQWFAIGTTDVGVDTVIAEIGLNQAGDTQTPFTLTASSVAGINGGSGFQTTDVGRTLRVMGSDGRWRWARIAARSSTTQVTIRLYGHALPDLNRISNWRIGAWSDESGWPAVVSLYNERLMYARTDTQPVTVWGSKQGTFDDFGISDPQLETDGIAITLLSSNMNEILALAADEDLQTFSSGQVRSIGPADLTKSMSAVNITQRKGPTSGADHLTPLSIGGVTLYVGAGGTKIRELVLGEQNRYVAPELSLLGEQFFKSGIVDWAFVERPDPIIYCVMGNGELVGVVYDREQRIVGFMRHQIAGGAVESVAVVPSPWQGFEDVYLVVRRTINGQTKRYIEVMERPFDGDVDDVEDALFVDCALSYDGSAISTVTGLGHLEGEEVVVLADGNVVDNLTVESGSVTLPYAAEKISVGLRYTSRGVTLPFAGPQRDGTLFGRRRTVQGVSTDVLYSGALKIGPAGSADWTPALSEQIFKTGDTLFGNPVELVSGVVPCQTEGSWAEGDGKIVFETDQPLPLMIRSLILQIEGEP